MPSFGTLRGLPVSAWTQEYDSCVCKGKSRLGRIINRFCVWRFNLGWWWVVGLPDLLGRKRSFESDDSFPSLPVGGLVSGPTNLAPEDIFAGVVGKQSTENPLKNSGTVL